MICDNNYHILAISDRIDGNHNDGFELIENIEILTETLKKVDIDIQNSHLNADAGFDTKAFIENKHKMIANIPKNKRNSKKIAQE